MPVEIFFIRFFWLIVILLSALLGVYAASPWIAETSIRMLLESDEVQLQKIDMQYPGLHRVFIDELEVNVASNAIIGKHITINYSLTDLAISQVDVETLTVRAVSAEQGDTSTLSIDIIMESMEAMWQQLPTRRLNIHLLEYSSADSGIQYVGTLSMDEKTILSKIKSIDTEWINALTGELILRRDGNLHFELSENRDPGNSIVLAADIPGKTFSHNLLLNTKQYSINNKGSGSWNAETTHIQIAPGSTAWLKGELWDSPKSRVEVKNPQQAVTLIMDTKSLRLKNGPNISLDMATGSIALEINTLDTDFAFNDLRFNGTYQFRSTDDKLSATSSFEARLTDQTLLQATLTALPGANFLSNVEPGLVINLLDPLSLVIEVDSLSFQTEASLISVESDQFNTTPLTVKIEQLEGVGDQLVHGNIQISLAALALTIPTEVSWAAPELKLRFNFDHTISIPPLAVLNLAEDMDFQTGRLYGNGQLNWHQTSNSVNINTITNAESLSGFYSDYPFSEVDGKFLISYKDGQLNIEPSLVTDGLIDFGFPVKDVTGKISLNEHQLLVSDFSASIFDGTISSPLINYQRETGTSQFVLVADHLSLDQILALEGDQITGSGILDGVIPLVILDDKITVKDGQFSSRAPGGTIRYKDAAQAAVSLDKQGFGFAIGALANFEYTVLSAGVNYAPTGDLALEIRLEGSNPKIENGRLIHYNLNISENIPTLLRSLQLSDEITEQVERRVKH